MALTGAELNILKTGLKPDGTKATPEDLAAIKAKATDLEIEQCFGVKNSASQTADVASALSGGGVEIGDGFVRTTKIAQTETPTSTVTHVETNTRNSNEFYASQDILIADMIEMGKKAEAEFNRTNDRIAADRMFYDGATEIIKSSVPPQIIKQVDHTDNIEYDNSFDPTSEQNEHDCTLGVLKQHQSEMRDYLLTSADPRLRELAIESKKGNLAATYALIGITDSWDPNAKENALNGRLSSDTDSNAGGQVIHEKGGWYVPAEFVSIEDYEKIKGNDQGEAPTPFKDTPRVGPIESYATLDTAIQGKEARISGVPKGSFIDNVSTDRFGQYILDRKRINPLSLEFGAQDNISDINKDGYLTLNELKASGKLGEEELALIEQGYGDEYGYISSSKAGEKNLYTGGKFEEIFVRIPKKD